MNMPSIFGPAAGWIKNPKQVRDICRVPDITHVTMGSFTLEPREGNVGGTPFYTRPDGSTINALGMPNRGIRTMIEDGSLAEMCATVATAGKHAVVSIAGFSPGEYTEAVSLVSKIPHVDTIEVNCGCPNVYQTDAKRHPIVSLDLDELLEVVIAVGKGRGNCAIWYKMSPHTDPNFRQEAAKTIALNGDGVVLCNTIPDGHWMSRSGKPVLGVAKGFGGVAGAALLELSLINVESYHTTLCEFGRRSAIKIIGAGGIAHGDHLRRYMQAGADGAVIGSAFFTNEDARVFGDVLSTANFEGEVT